MNDGHFKTLSVCMAISVGLLIGATVLKVHALLAFLSGGLPLIYYHVLYLAPRARKGLSQAAIDSVYYFGFLITVAALGISAVAIATTGAVTNTNTVVLQFGVGLFATGYAVVARMHLSSISTRLDELSPEAIMDRYIKRSMELLDNVELAVVRTSEFSSTVISRTTEVTNAARVSAEQSMREVAQIFEAEMRSVLSESKNSLQEVRDLVKSTTFHEERETLIKGIQTTVDVTSKMNQSIEAFSHSAQEGAALAEKMIASLGGTTQSLEELERTISDLGRDDGPLLISIDRLHQATEAIAKGTESVGKSVVALSESSEAIVDTGQTFQKMRTVAKKASEQLDAMAGVSERLDGALQSILTTGQATGTLVAEFGKAASAVPGLAESVEKLRTNLDKTTLAATDLEVRLLKLPIQEASVQSTASSITSHIGQIVEALELAANRASNLGEGIGKSTAIIADVQELLRNATELKATVNAIQQSLSGLAESVTTAQAALAASAQNIKASIASSSVMLEEDVKRSAEAAGLLTDRLVDVAQIIIDRTREHQGTGR